MMGVPEETNNIDSMPGSSKASQEDGPAPPPNVDDAALLRKIDLRVVPMLFAIYFVAFLDRVNISNALTMGMPEQLDILTGDRQNIALLVFYIPYIVFEIPSNIIMKKVQPHIWLSTCIIAFGIVMLAQAFVKNYAGLVATRFFLGLAESGIFPGSFYLLSFWYKRAEAQKRFTMYWSSVIFAGAFGSLIASGIAKMDGMRGLENWRWIFLLEGIASILMGIIALFFCADFPQQASWLSEDEKAAVIAKTRNFDTDDVVTKADLSKNFKDIKMYLGAIMYFTVVVPIYAFSYFAPTIIKALHYDTIQTQLHSVPPFAAALGLSLLTAFFSDRFNIRYPFILLGNLLIIIGLALMLTQHGTSHFSTEYLGICFITMGAFSSGAIIVCWVLMNMQGHKERSIGSAFVIGIGNAGGIVAVFCFTKDDAANNYKRGYWILMAMALAGTASIAAYGLTVARERRRQTRVDNITDGEKVLSL